jgi:hypothetical protein
MTRKSVSRKDAKQRAHGAGADRKSERPGTATKKLGKRLGGAKETGQTKSEKTPRVGEGPVRRARGGGEARKPAQLGQSVEGAGPDRGERGAVPGARPAARHPDVQETGADGGRAFEIGERVAGEQAR